jgi:hypothetical protein
LVYATKCAQCGKVVPDKQLWWLAITVGDMPEFCSWECVSKYASERKVTIGASSTTKAPTMADISHRARGRRVS